MKKYYPFIPIIFLIVAIVLWLRGQHIISRTRWVVLEQPIEVTEGFTVTNHFTVDISCNYEVEIKCDRKLEHELLAKFLSDKVKASFSITSQDVEIFLGDTSSPKAMSYTRDDISRRIDFFPAEPKNDYQITFVVTETLSELSGTSPTLQISVEPIVFKNAYVKASLSAHAALLSLFISLASALLILVRFIKQKIKQNNASKRTS